MSGFDLPPIRGFDQSFQHDPQALAPNLEGIEPDPFAIDGIEQDSVGQAGDVETARPFSGFLADSLNSVQDLRSDVHEKVSALVRGEDVEIHDVMIAGSKSEVAFNLLVEVRNQLVEAWETLSRSVV